MAGSIIEVAGNSIPFARSAYFSRLGLDPATVEPTISFLRRVTRAHVASIPFENLDAVLGRTINIDLKTITEKVLRDRRGGYCFEHNNLMLHALKDMGFSNVQTVLGRVLWSVPERICRTHMFNIVHVEGKRLLVDVGFGGSCSCDPLDLDKRGPQKTPLGVYSVQEVERHPNWKEYTVATLHQKKTKKGETPQPPVWRTLYVFDLQPQEFVDCDMANYFIYSNSTFRDVLSCSLQLPDERKRITVLNRTVSVYLRPKGSKAMQLEESITARDSNHLFKLLREKLQIEFSSSGPFAVTQDEFADAMDRLEALPAKI